jgi:hypothetical protein
MLPNEEMDPPDPQRGCGRSNPFGGGDVSLDWGFAGDDSGSGRLVGVGVTGLGTDGPGGGVISMAARRVNVNAHLELTP